ncbi:MAG: minor capsid protein [Alphaproteobacteria bacterium]|nr:minor capsid protein [Alphaproteobacteria bacterium]
MASGLIFKPVEPREAIDYLKSKGINPLPSFAWQDVWQEEHATAFTVAKSAGFDILDDIHQALVKAQELGLPYRRFAKELRPTLTAKGWWGKKRVTDPATGESVVAQLGSPRRLQIIFDVNMRMSYAVGNWQRAEGMKATRPYLRYVAVDDGRTRPEHLAWHNTVLPVDDPFWRTHYPPNGWRCRCTAQSVGNADLKTHGWGVSKNAPPIKWEDWLNKRTGEMIKVPAGIDAGFGYNAGMAARRLDDPAKYLNADIGHASAKASVASPDFAKLLRGDLQGSLPVGYIDQTLAAKLGTNVKRVDLSADTMVKQRANHPDLTADEYRLLPDIFQKGLVLGQSDSRLVFFKHAGRLYKAVIKSDGERTANYLVSFHRADAKEIERERHRKGSALIRDFVKEGG